MRKFFYVLLLMAAPLSTFANYTTVRNVFISNDNQVNMEADISFDIAWENSWRDGINYDASWVFVKYYDAATKSWKHANLASAPSSGTGTGMTAEITADNIGCYLYRASDGAGNISQTGVVLRWDYSGTGLSSVSGLKVRVYATEMVFIPQGSFSLGDGNGTLASNNSLRLKDMPNHHANINNHLSPLINDNSGIGAMINGIRIDGDGGVDTDGDGTIDNPDFPTGYKAFYTMKYHMTQGQYCDFLNALPYTQRQTYKITSVTTIQEKDSLFYSSRPDLPMNYLRKDHCLAFMDWAGLRPMTECEFEKAARGPLAPVPNEGPNGQPSYEWAGSPFGELNGTEKLGDVDMNFQATPLRVGIFAESTTNRVQAGSSFYGVMDMTSFGVTYMVPVQTTTNLAFTGNHGNGNLNVSGSPDVADWPDHTTVTDEVARGNYWNISYRSNKFQYYYTIPNVLRAVRSAW